LRALYESVGLDAGKDAETVTIGGRRQNAAFAAGQVDALYAHTPFLEQAIVHQDAIVIVDQAGGEVKELSNRQIHALTFSRSFLERRREDAVAMVRAIARAQTLIRKSPSDTANALAKRFPQRDRAEIDLLAHLYSSAVPASPIVSVEGLAPALLFFPEGEDKPSLAGIDLSTFVAPDLARDATKGSAPKSSLVYEMLIGVGVLAAMAWRFRAARSRGPTGAQK
jgi:ABC-type nitrate/sulfonate/bicarbonate transport system substrate-binding protein